MIFLGRSGAGNIWGVETIPHTFYDDSSTKPQRAGEYPVLQKFLIGCVTISQVSLVVVYWHELVGFIVHSSTAEQERAVETEEDGYRIYSIVKHRPLLYRVITERRYTYIEISVKKTVYNPFSEITNGQCDHGVIECASALVVIDGLWHHILGVEIKYNLQRRFHYVENFGHIIDWNPTRSLAVNGECDRSFD